MSATIYSFQTGKVIQSPEPKPIEWGAPFAEAWGQVRDQAWVDVAELVDCRSAIPVKPDQSPLERLRAYVRELRDLYFEEDDV